MAESIKLKIIYSDGGAKASLSEIDALIKKINSTPVNVNIKSSDISSVKKYAASWDSVDASQINAKNSASSVSAGLKEVSSGADKAGDSLLSSAKKMATWMLLGNVIAGIKRSFIEALDEMKAVDDELVVVRKVTGATSEELGKMADNAYEAASAYGILASEYLSSVATYSRAGYGEQAEALAELSAKTQIVGDVSEQTADQFILATDAAYGFNGSIEELNAVLDGANEIDNKYATSIEKIASGLGIVAPVAAQANMSVSELTAAIGTITAVTQRSGTEAATALRAIILNIVGDTTTEIEDGATWTAGQIEGLSDIIKTYAKDAYDAARASGEVIDPMRAIAGLAQSMKDGVLSASQLYSMISDIGGKLRASQLTALVENYDMYESMLASYASAAGSADKEVSNALDSWTVKTNQLSNAWTQFIANTVDSDAIKSLIDIAKWFITFEGDLGSSVVKWGALIAAINADKLVSGWFNLKKNISASFDGIKSFFGRYNGDITKSTLYTKIYNDALAEEAAKQQITVAQIDNNTRATIANTAAKKANAAAIVSGIGLAITAVVAVVQVIQSVSNAIDEARQKAIETASELAEQSKETSDSLNELIEKYKELAEIKTGTWDTSTISEVRGIQSDIIDLVGEQANGLDLVNGKLQENLDILYQAAEQQAKTAYLDARAGTIATSKVLKSKTPSNKDRWDVFDLYNAAHKYGIETPGGSLFELGNASNEKILEYYNMLVAVRRAMIESGDEGTAVYNHTVESISNLQDSVEAYTTALEAENEAWAKNIYYARYAGTISSAETYESLIGAIQSGTEITGGNEAQTKALIQYIQGLYASKYGTSTDASGTGDTPATKDEILTFWDELNEVVKENLQLKKDTLAAEKEERDTLQEQYNLDNKRLAVEKARQALYNAENERTVRIFNAASGQWEWQANANAVATAKETLANAQNTYENAQYTAEYNAKSKAISGEESAWKGAYKSATQVAPRTSEQIVADLENSGNSLGTELAAKAREILGLSSAGASSSGNEWAVKSYSTSASNNSQSTVNNANKYYYINGVSIGSNMVNAPLSSILSKLEIYAE